MEEIDGPALGALEQMHLSARAKYLMARKRFRSAFLTERGLRGR
jgi:hypothetical protein